MVVIDGTRRAHRIEVPEPANPLLPADYASAFEVSIADCDARSAEEWGRAIFEDAPAALRGLVVFGWRHVLRFRLGPSGSAGHVLGWTISASTPDSLSLEVRSALTSARKVLRVDDYRLRVSTFVRYERPLGRVLWTAVAPVHHLTEPYLLGTAASRCGEVHPESHLES
jgi:Protein of unknown function (DUF2867)